MIKVSCLPIAGTGNPYQLLMMEGLASAKNIQVKHGVEDKFFGIVRTGFRDRPDYIHFDWIHQYYLRRSHFFTFLLFPFFTIQILIVKYLFGIKIVWTLHNITPHDRPYFGPYKWCRMFFAIQCTWIRVFAKSTALEASSTLGVSLNKFEILPEGDFVNFYPNSICSNEARSKLNLFESQLIFLFFGAMRPYKGIEELIRVFNQFKKPNWQLLIVGKCLSISYKERLSKLVINNDQIVLNANNIADEDIQLYMNAADIIVLPFRKIENSGSAILSMGFKKAVIAPKKGVIPIRLAAQHELLYNNKLDEIIRIIDHIGKNKLREIGENNYANLSNHKWIDFQKLFT